MPEQLTRIVVFTRDLRVHDNPVLAAAAAGADAVLPVFVRDDRIAANGFSGEPRQRFLDAGLADLDRALRGLGAALVIRHGDLATEVARLADRYDAESVHIAADVSGFSTHRRQRLRRALAGTRSELVEHQAVTTIQPAGAITPNGSDHFSVFTPYYRHWLQVPRRPSVPSPDRLRLPAGADNGRVPESGAVYGWLGGETEARTRANAWFADGLARYEERHDDLAADATSHLSPYLHLGHLSPSELATKAAERPSPGSTAFLRQLAWRDFHAQVLAARPGAAWQDYRPRGDRWSGPDSALDAWRAGTTGFPLVDAGMRQLAAIGWMHNRARLVVGSFLTKTLYLDWRLGARHFLDHLVDGDLANNNLNWQWVAGTGTDTRPSRVLNPVRQAERYDPDGAYIRRWVPELADLSDAADVHQPWRLPAARRRALGYPDPVVDLAEGRARFLAGRDGR
jgi:deoxyribodipyrimidine photo-lyase